MSRKRDTEPGALITAQADPIVLNPRAEISALAEKLEMLRESVGQNRAYLTTLRLAMEAATQYKAEAMAYHLTALVQVARDIEQVALEQQMLLMHNDDGTTVH